MKGRPMKKRLVYVDVINCMAIFFVLMLHSSQLANVSHAYTPVVKETRVIQALCIPAVYLFFMNSGATILNYRTRYSTKEFFKHRFTKVLIPFLVWSVLYYLYDLKWKAYPGPIPQSNPSISNFWQAFSSNTINNIFWFFYVILGLYIVTPLLSKLSPKTMAVLIIIIACIYDLIPYVLHLFNTSIPAYQKFLTWFQYVADGEYFLMGHLIRQELMSKKVENGLIFCGGLAFLATFVSAWTYDRFTFFTGLSPFLYSVALYLVVKRASEHITNKRVQSLFRATAGGSLGLYILHPVFYSWYQAILHVNWVQQSYILGMPVVVYIVGTSFILFIKKSKLIRIILP